MPIAKKAGAIEPKDFRPVALSSCVGKIVESLVTQQLRSHLEHRLPTELHGYVTGKGTFSAINSLTEKAKEAKRHGLKAAMIFADGSCAFDAISHELIMRTLAYVGAGERTLIVL